MADLAKVMGLDVLAVGVSFTELAGGEDYANTTDNTWEDWDLSAIIGAGATVVLLMGSNISTTNAYSIGVRKNGSALVRYDVIDQCLRAEQRSQILMIAECDANRVIETFSNKDTCYFQCLGYWS